MYIAKRERKKLSIVFLLTDPMALIIEPSTYIFSSFLKVSTLGYSKTAGITSFIKFTSIAIYLFIQTSDLPLAYNFIKALIKY